MERECKEKWKENRQKERKENGKRTRTDVNQHQRNETRAFVSVCQCLISVFLPCFSLQIRRWCAGARRHGEGRDRCAGQLKQRVATRRHRHPSRPWRGRRRAVHRRNGRTRLFPRSPERRPRRPACEGGTPGECGSPPCSHAPRPVSGGETLRRAGLSHLTKRELSPFFGFRVSFRSLRALLSS